MLLQDGSIRVDLPNALYENTPYTVQPGGCGDPGEYIHVTRDFLRDLNDQSTESFGPPGMYDKFSFFPYQDTPLK